MMAGKNQAALAVCAQTKVIFPFKGWLGSFGRKRWSARPALGTLVIFKRTKLSLRYFCAGYPGNILSVIRGTEPIDWFAFFFTL